MFDRFFTRLTIVCAVLGLVACSLTAASQDAPKRGRKYKAPPATSRIEVTVVRDIDGKPVEHAAVIFHLVGEKGNMELKSNEDGKSMIDVLPMGSEVRLQIIAKGFQTYGEDFKIDKPVITIDVRMKRPGEQYSIYKNHGGEASGEGKDKPAPKQDAPVPAEPK